MSAIETFALARTHGITPAGIQGLVLILANPGENFTWLAAEMGCSTSNLTGLIDTLENAGWIRRERSSLDRRILCLLPTAKAIEIFTA